MFQDSIDLCFPYLPPAHDAIGEYTAALAIELSKSVRVRVLTSIESDFTPIENVEVLPCFSLRGPNRFTGLLRTIREADPRPLVLQYNPYSWGRRGWAPELLSFWTRLKRIRSDSCLTIMFHETFTEHPSLKARLQKLYQKYQFYSLLKRSSLAFFSSGRWSEGYRRFTWTQHLPVGSNLPKAHLDGREYRRSQGYNQSDLICGTFGGAHPSRLTEWIIQGVNHLYNGFPNKAVKFLHVGDGAIDWSRIRCPVKCTGRIDPQEAADAIASLDLMLNPFVDGLTTRRGSAMASIQQGVPLFSTKSENTEGVWGLNTGQFLSLTDLDDLTGWKNALENFVRKSSDQSCVRAAAIEFYTNNFSWEKITGLLLSSIQTFEKGREK